MSDFYKYFGFVDLGGGLNAASLHRNRYPAQGTAQQ